MYERDVDLAQKGDIDAFSRLIKECESTLYRVSYGILKSDHDCADAIQEAILKSFKSITSLKNKQYFKTWIIRILINECHNILRHKKRLISIENMKEPSYEEKFDHMEVSKAINQLNPDQKVIVILFYYEGFSIKEIVEVLNVHEGTVKSRLHRARIQLAQLLNIDFKKESEINE
jgi:RNA polymerase sigma-70 factor, ECF subfamily